MKNTGKENDIEEIKDLRIKSGTEANLPDFKKAVFGGYDVDEVKEYIDSMKVQHNNTLEAYQERIDEFTTFVEMLQKEKNDLAAAAASAKDSLAASEKAKAASDSQSTALKEEISGFRTEMEAAAARNQACAEEITALKSEIASLKGTLTGIETEKGALEAGLAAQSDESAKQKRLIDTLTGQNKSSSDEIAALKKKLAKYEEDEEYAASLRDKIDLTHENELLREEIHSLSLSRDAIASETVTLKSQIESLTENVNKLRTDNQELQFRNNSLLSQIRQTDMNIGMKTGEFVQKQAYNLDRSTDALNSVISAVAEIKEEAAKLKKYINETMISKSDTI